jgi:uroporphyrinogen-III synthase
MATIDGHDIVLRGATAGTTDPETADGEAPAIARGEARGPVDDRIALAGGLAMRLTAELATRAGAGDGRGRSADATNRAGTGRVLVTRAAGRSADLLAALTALDLEPIAIPTIEIRPVDAGGDLDAAVLRAVAASWIAITSVNAIEPVLAAAARQWVDLSGPRWAAVGAATAAALEARGIDVDFVPSATDGAALGAELPIRPGDTVFLPRTDVADWRLVGSLELRGARVDAVVAYRTVEGPETSRERLRALFAAGGPEAIVFTSGSTVRGLVALLGRAHLELARRAVACCIGEPTAAAARNAGFELVLVAPATKAAALAGLVRTAVGAPAGSPATDPVPATGPAPATPAPATDPAPERRQEDPA